VANSRLDSERGALAQQLRTSYVTGRQEVLKLLLNQQNPARLGRMVIYYDYLNRARSLLLEVVESELKALTRLTAENVDVGLELTRLGQAQAAELSALESSRDDRRAALAALEQDITTSGDEIRRLRDEAQRLGELVAELETSLGLFPPETAGGISSVAGELSWPVAGSLDSDFGEARAGGQLRWSGVVMSAPAGTPVRAVYYGRVAYADWLPGLGLLIIIEHGSGYMSLYGHNEALLKESGDRVVPGDVIAYVGDSGGQTQTALYFEIRRDGEPIDPHPWMAREPGATR
jgi:septal ring factor EnvC (AmiA/AmiB activator)